MQTDGNGNWLTANANIYLSAGKYPLLSPASSPLDPGLLFASTDTRNGATITFQNVTGEIAIIHGALEFSGGDSTVGSWSAVTFQAYDGGDSDISMGYGMKTVTALKFTFDSSSGIYADLQARIAGLRAANVNGGRGCFTQLFVDDVRKTRARHPNVRAFNVDTQEFDSSTGISGQTAAVRIPPCWVDAGHNDFTPILDGETEIVFTRAWQQIRAAITDYRLVTVGGEARFRAVLGDLDNPVAGGVSTYPLEDDLAEVSARTSIVQTGPEETWNRGWLENNKAFLDHPGEWYFDDDEIALYYMPSAGEDVTSETFQIPVTYHLISFQGVENQTVTGIQFIGQGSGNDGSTSTYYIEFEHSAWKHENARGNDLFYSFAHAAYGSSGLVDGAFTDSIAFQNCEFAGYGAAAINLGGNRLWVYGKRDRSDYDDQVRGAVTNTLLNNNYFTDGGGGGIRIDDYPQFTGDTAPLDNNRITSNSILKIGQIFADATGIEVTHGVNTVISGNSIFDVPSEGISGSEAGCYLASNERMIVSDNGVSRAMRKLLDGGAIYFSGDRYTQIYANTATRTGAARDPDAEEYAGSFNLLTDLYLDNTSAYFTVFGNDIDKLFYRSTTHDLSGQIAKKIFVPPNLDKDVLNCQPDEEAN